MSNPAREATMQLLGSGGKVKTLVCNELTRDTSELLRFCTT